MDQATLLSNCVVKKRNENCDNIIPVLESEIREYKKNDATLRSIVEATINLRGRDFFTTLVKHLSSSLNVKYAFVGKSHPNNPQKIITIAMHANGAPGENISYDLTGTPCEEVFGKKLQYYAKDTWRLFPEDVILKEMQIECYLGVPLFSAAGDAIGILVIMHDSSDASMLNDAALLQTLAVLAGAEMERQELFEQLIEAKQCAETASVMKSQFIANMSHEIRTPLAAITGFAEEIAAYRADPANKDDFIKIIRSNCDKLNNLFNDIIDISKIENGSLFISKSLVSPINIINECYIAKLNSSQEKGIDLRVKFSGSPELIFTDSDRLKQILLHLIENSIKFTTSGAITIEANSLASDGEIVFRIVDSGCGMSPDQIKDAFKKFTQLDQSDTRSVGGAGLGLAICEKLVAILGGRINTVSSPNHGTTIEVILPKGEFMNDQESILSKSAKIFHRRLDLSKTTTTLPMKNSITGTNILLAEDAPDLQLLTKIILKNAGAIIDCANNGQEAVDLIQSNPQKYSVVLMDMQMPILDGFSAVRFLRKQNYQTPIVAVTAHAMIGDKEKCLNSGCDDYLFKPFKKIDLINKVAKWANSPETQQPPTQSEQISY